MSIKQIFLQQIDNFIKELSNLFPNNGEIQLFNEKYNLIRSANSKLIIEYFVQFIYPFKNQIMSKDDQFFLGGGGQEELKDKSGLKFRDSIKKIWVSEISIDNKEIIWKYFGTFILLCEKYNIEK